MNRTQRQRVGLERRRLSGKRNHAGHIADALIAGIAQPVGL